MSLLLANGHPNARQYTLGRIQEEVALLGEWNDMQRKENLVRLRLMVATLPTFNGSERGVKTAQKLFDRWLKQD